MNYYKVGLSTLLAGVIVTAGCENFLEVRNPGGIQDDALDDDIVFSGLVFGMEEDFGVALSELAMDGGVMADEWTYVGNAASTRNYQDGVLRSDQVDTHWNQAQRARWVAEDGVARMLDVWGQERVDQSELALRARLAAGFANRLIGEFFCEDVFDGGNAEPHTVAFQRAEEHFSEAARIAQAQGMTDYQHAALGGRASVRAWLGNWSAAEEDAAQVPVEFSHMQMYWADGATFPSSGGRAGNWVWRDNAHRDLFTVAESRWAEAGVDNPRTPSDTLYASDGSVRVAGDGATPWIQQRKYPEPGSDIPLVQGTELLLLRAEARLEAGDVGSAVSLINESRAHYGLAPVAATGEADAWELLKDERAAETWLEARRLWDLRRWEDPFLSGRDSCIPISDRERISNPNL